MYVFDKFIKSSRSICWDRLVSEIGKTGFVVTVSNRAGPMILGRLRPMLSRAEFLDIYNHKMTVARNFQWFAGHDSQESQLRPT